MAPALVLTLFFALILPGFPLARLIQATTPPSAAAIPRAVVEQLPGEQEVKALAAAWPDRISEASFRNGDWVLRVGGEWFAWAHGRLLPEAEASQWEESAALPFYSYPLTLQPLAPVSEERANQLRQRVRENEKNPPRRSEKFLSALLEAGDRNQTEARLLKMEVAGFTVTVHKRIEKPLRLVSEELAALKKSDPQVASFLKGLVEMNGYNYRYVAGTRSRSLHSYGLAVDLIPRSYGGKRPYWQWANDNGEEFWAIPYEKRWMPPVQVIEAFESNGFVWGGKWLFFDTMHFEYRPEIMLLARLRALPETPQPDTMSEPN